MKYRILQAVSVAMLLVATSMPFAYAASSSVLPINRVDVHMTTGALAKAKKPSLAALVKLIWNKSMPVRVLWTAYQAYDLAGWEAGRLLAVRDGLPDPGPKPNASLLQKVIYRAASQLGY